MNQHISVFKNEAISALDIKPEGVYVDATLGRAGHSLQIVKQLDSGHLYCFDLDDQALLDSANILQEYKDKVTLIHSNFAQIENKLNQHGITEIDGILFDLGVSSPQFDDPDRGFSYRYDAPLDMRMNQQQSLSAMNVVNEYDLSDLNRILKEYGEEKFSYKIAQSIIASRPIHTTLQLVDAIKKALPQRVLRAQGHPAKQTFQAIRIEVNGELQAISVALEQAIRLLKPNGRLVVITFHSLEDRIVKQLFNTVSTPPKVNKRLPQLEKAVINYEHLTKQVIKPSQTEIENNPRSQSAKLRILARKGESNEESTS